MFGLTPDLLGSIDYPLWPENMQAFQVFEAMMTQWRCGPGGPTGLVYSEIPVVMRYLSIPEADHGEVFDAVRVMESAALEAIHQEK
ncbi:MULTISPECIES: DUF1799 domain-containing protein [Pseudomonas]|uniref:Phage protein n=1 Tax=Pseudomonas lutea TaxID=243924 RepID=A0A9X8MHX4_9PSED|nr:MULTISPECIES: DUF1799 domain-containing protein [Pseudomonas]SER52296.1 Phage related hypothetical protein [Pseudomonas lutea]SER52787.1 Phage related hypothetical protein [Pseudomonas lutea]